MNRTRAAFPSPLRPGRRRTVLLVGLALATFTAGEALA